MEMEETRKRIRKLIFIGFGIIFLQVMIGTVSVTIGILYREFDRARAYEMMDIIKQEDRNYYALLNNPDDRTYLEEFNRLNTNRGNPVLIMCGMVILFLSVCSIVPLMAIHREITGRTGDTDEEKPDEVKPVSPAENKPAGKTAETKPPEKKV